MISSCKYYFDSISAFFVFAGIELIPFELPCLSAAYTIFLK